MEVGERVGVVPDGFAVGTLEGADERDGAPVVGAIVGLAVCGSSVGDEVLDAGFGVGGVVGFANFSSRLLLFIFFFFSTSFLLFLLVDGEEVPSDFLSDFGVFGDLTFLLVFFGALDDLLLGYLAGERVDACFLPFDNFSVLARGSSVSFSFLLMCTSSYGVGLCEGFARCSTLSSSSFSFFVPTGDAAFFPDFVLPGQRVVLFLPLESADLDSLVDFE